MNEGSNLIDIGSVLGGNRPIQVDINLTTESMIKIFVLFIGALILSEVVTKAIKL